MPTSKLRITQTLLSSWMWISKKEDGGYEDFLKTLRREKTPPTQQMLDGVRFENCVNSVLDGQPMEFEHEWFQPVMRLAHYLKGSQQQVTLFRDINVNGVDFLLHGVLDFLKAGVIYDTKFSKTYHMSKYLDSPQHPMYFALVPEAYEFQYLICDGKYTYKETYRPEDCVPIDSIIKQFMNFLELNKLVDEYAEHWMTKN